VGNAKQSWVNRKIWTLSNKLISRETPESYPSKIANQFNQFFTTVVKQISENVMPVRKNPEDYVEYGREIQIQIAKHYS